MKENQSKKILALIFVCLIFTGLVGNACKAYHEKEDCFSLYSSYLGEALSTPAKLKAGLLSFYDYAGRLDEKTAFKKSFINLYGLAKRVNPAPCPDTDGTVRLKDGSLGLFAPEAQALEEKAQNIKALEAELKALGSDLLYIQLLGKIKQDDFLLPKGLKDFENSNADDLLAALENKGVKSFDLRKDFGEKGKDYSSLFYRTDHHWKVETGLRAARITAENLNEDFDFGMDTDCLKRENFKEESYDKIFLGSLGKRVGLLYAGSDDFALLTPAYETNFGCKYHMANGNTILKEGSFEEAWIFKENLKRDYFSANVYATYAGGSMPLIKCENKLIKGKKLLVLADSFADTLLPFLSIGCQSLVIVDPRLYEGDLAELTARERPDLTLIIYNPSAINNDDFFNFG